MPHATVRCWGDQQASGPVGPGVALDASTSTPTLVTGVSNVTQIAGGGLHACAIVASKDVWCWGENARGQLGIGTTTGPIVTPQHLTMPPALQVVIGSDHSCALVQGGTVQCWGSDEFGQLGRTATYSSSPSVPDAVAQLDHVTSIQAGFDHTCARKDDGSVLCWGRNDHGQVGDGTTTKRSVPTAVVW